MTEAPAFARLVSAAAGCAAATIVLAGLGHAQQDDFAACTALHYGRVRTDTEIAETIAVCTRVIAAPAASAEQSAHALYFRGLNHFLGAVNRAIADGKAIGSGGDAIQSRLDSALADAARICSRSCSGSAATSPP